MRRLKLFVVTLLVVVSFSHISAASASGTCPTYERALTRFSPGWDVNRMSQYMYRESRCLPYVRSTTRDSGLLQINDVNHAYLRTALNQWVDSETLKRPKQNIRAAAALCVYWIRAGKGCYYPWGG